MKLAHYLMLVLIAFRYNVNTGIRRHSRHNFGQPYLFFIDRIQDRYQQLFNVKLFRRHRNLSHFQPVKDFVAVGVGPLCISEEYVCLGDPLPHLTGDLHFLAERMGVQCPPLGVQGKDECKMFSTFMLSNPALTDTAVSTLCKWYLEKSDGKTIFPKTPSMIKSYYRQWQHNQLIRKVVAETKSAINRTINQLHRVHAPPIVCEDHIIDSDVDGTVPALNFVSPPAAQVQESYVPASDVSQRNRFCYYVGYCNEMANVCGGQRKGGCRNVNSGAVVIPTDENEFKRVKEYEKRKRRAERVRQERQRKKQK